MSQHSTNEKCMWKVNWRKTDGKMDRIENVHGKYKFTVWKQYSLVLVKILLYFIILLTVFCIFWPEFGLKPRYFALHVMENIYTPMAFACNEA